MASIQKIISVFGSSAPPPGSADYEAARMVGHLLARAGFAVQTGGYSGTMAAASQGASEAGGHVIGVTSAQIERFRPTPPNQWVVEEIKCQTLHERQLHLISNCHGAIVMPGGIGTLAEQLGCDKSKLVPILSELVSAKRVKRTGEKRGTKYQAKETMATPSWASS